VGEKLRGGLTIVADEEVRELKPEEYSLWDDLVDQSPHGTIFHTSSWLIIISIYFKKDFKIIGFFHDGKLIGGCSLFIYNLLMGHLKYVSSTCDFTPYGGFVIAEEKSNKIRELEQFRFLIIKKICDYLHENRLDSNYLEITNSPSFKDIRPFTRERWKSKIPYTYSINLQNNLDQNISKDIRKKIKFCIQNSIKIEKSENVNAHYNLLSKVFRIQKFESPPKEFYQVVIDLLRTKNIGEMWIAETLSGDVIASRIVLWDRKRAYAWSAASDPDVGKREGNAFLLYHTLQELKERGFKEIDVMQANTPRFSFFITGFNPDLSPYYKIYKKNWVFCEIFKIHRITTWLLKKNPLNKN
jgi:hypothetical protein